jgi:DNA-binding NarL/FixJ family response regulator
VQPSPPPATVLIIEGDELVLRSCADMLSAAGMQVRTAMAGSSALLALGEGDVHVVVANLQLPDVTGPELLRAIRERDSDLPVIFVTTWPSFAAETIATGSSGGTRNSADALRGTVVTAAVGYRVGQRARRRTRSPSSPPEGE